MLQLCRFYLPGAGPRLAAVESGQVFDLTATGQGDYASFAAWLKSTAQQGVDRAFHGLQETVSRLPAVQRWSDLLRPPLSDRPHLLPPIDAQEVWAAGVTYLRSRDAREEESERIGIYDKVYDAKRPEIFFKATPHRVVGTHDSVRIRADSNWNVPEPELTAVLAPDLQVVGYTVGNDVSSRDIEGENPLYLPQAKIYTGCCALGPAVTLVPEFSFDEPASIEMTIQRHEEDVFQGETSTGQMKRTIVELVSYLGRHNTFPDGA